MTDDKKLIERLRAEADLDARAGEPLGKRMREAAARLEALTATQGEAVVKPLEWVPSPNGQDQYAACLLGRYDVGKIGERFAAILRHEDAHDGTVDVHIGWFGTAEAAKAAAQADYERRILSALTHPTPDRGELAEALRRLLSCPAIADENHSDPAWGGPRDGRSRVLRVRRPHQAWRRPWLSSPKRSAECLQTSRVGQTVGPFTWPSPQGSRPLGG